MNKYLSDKIKAISFLLIIFVVFLHSTNLKVNFKTHQGLVSQGINSFIQHFISEGITRTAVPLFFIISGYLFFLNIKEGAFSEFKLKYKKRAKTLLIPYLFWSAYGLALLFFLQSIPFLKVFFTKELISNYSITDFLLRLFVNPIPYQLWFVRDLIILIFFSPAFYWLVKKTNGYITLMYFALWLIDFEYSIIANDISALLFFNIGATIGIRKLNINTISQPSYRYVALWIILLLTQSSLFFVNFEHIWIMILLYKIGILVGIVAIWHLYDNIFYGTEINQKKYYFVFEYTFFLYAFHEPVLSMLKKGGYFLLGVSEATSLAVYILAPLATITISLVVGYYAKAVIPKLYSFITGDR